MKINFVNEFKQLHTGKTISTSQSDKQIKTIAILNTYTYRKLFGKNLVGIKVLYLIHTVTISQNRAHKPRTNTYKISNKNCVSRERGNVNNVNFLSQKELIREEQQRKTHMKNFKFKFFDCICVCVCTYSM